MSASIRRRARVAAEAVLRKQARTVRKVMLATGRDEAPLLPEIVQIESTNICNAKCVFCPRDDMDRDQGVMDMALFKKVADECAELGITHVRMHNYGEAFVDKRLVEKVRYAKSIGIKEVGLISNGSLITEAAARGMVEAGLDAINISMDAAGKEVFESTRLGLKYDKVVASSPHNGGHGVCSWQKRSSPANRFAICCRAFDGSASTTVNTRRPAHRVVVTWVGQIIFVRPRTLRRVRASNRATEFERTAKILKMSFANR